MCRTKIRLNNGVRDAARAHAGMRPLKSLRGTWPHRDRGRGRSRRPGKRYTSRHPTTFPRNLSPGLRPYCRRVGLTWPVSVAAIGRARSREESQRNVKRDEYTRGAGDRERERERERGS